MKKFILGVIAGVGITATGSVFADGIIERVDAYINPSIPVTVDGKAVTLDKPVAVIDGSSYLPVKALGQVVGKEVNWNADTQTIELKSVIDPSKAIPTKDSGKSSSNAQSTPDVSVQSRPQNEAPAFEKINNYYPNASSPAIKINNVIYVTVRNGAEHYQVSDVSWIEAEHAILFSKSGLKVIVSDNIGEGDAFIFEGSTYIKEDIFLKVR